MRQAIVTKYLGPTDHRGSRVKAIADAGSITLSWDHALNPEDNHRAAAEELARSKGWLWEWKGSGKVPARYRLEGGGMPQTTPYAYCFVLVPNGDS